MSVPLEDWIEADPGLVFDGLVIVGRQVAIDASTRLDLLGIDPGGRMIVIEIKAGRLYRAAIAQAPDYVAALRTLPVERLRAIAEAYLGERPNPKASERLGAALASDGETSSREVAGLVVGTGRDPGADRLLEFLASDHGVAIEAVTFEVFGLRDGKMILIREIAENSPKAVAESPSERDRLEAVLAQAGAVGVRALFEELLAAGTRLGLYVRPYKRSLMFTPPTNKTRMLFTIWARSHERSNMYTSAETFEQFFPGVSADDARHEIGQRATASSIRRW